MRVLFLGTSVFAVPALRALLAEPEHQVLGVVTQPDRPHGRGGRTEGSPVKLAAQQAGLSLWQPEKVRAPAFVQTVRELAPDVLVVAAFGQIIPQRLLDLPPFGGINIHGSLLPRWRGAAPMQYALMAGDQETGVTTMQMDAGVDTGDILLQTVLPLADEDNLEVVETRLSGLGARLLLQTLTRLADGTCPRIPQDPARVTPAPTLPPGIGALDWSSPAHDLHNLVRGLTPRPGAYAFWQGKRLKIWRTEVVEDTEQPPAASAAEPGLVQKADAGGITVTAGKGALRLLDVQPESKGRMPAGAWARGARAASGQRFDREP